MTSSATTAAPTAAPAARATGLVRLSSRRRHKKGFGITGKKKLVRHCSGFC